MLYASISRSKGISNSYAKRALNCYMPEGDGFIAAHSEAESTISNQLSRMLINDQSFQIWNLHRAIGYFFTVLLPLLGITLLNPTAGHSSSLLSDCVWGYEMVNLVSKQGRHDITGSYVMTERADISPAGTQCMEQCRKSCKAFSSLGPGSLELNGDLIHNCESACQVGQSFSARKLKASFESNPFGTKGMPVCTYYYDSQITTAGSSCSNNTAYFVSKLQYSIGDALHIRLNNTAANKIYMCGAKEVTLLPIMPNLFELFPEVVRGGDAQLAHLNLGYGNYSCNYFINPSNTPGLIATGVDTSSPPLDWRGLSMDNKTYKQAMNPCTANIDAGGWNTIGNANLWECSTDPQVQTCPLQSLGADSTIYGCFLNWHVRNNTNYTGTGIYLGNGDELSVEWMGNIFVPTGSTSSAGGYLDQKSMRFLLASWPNDSRISNWLPGLSLSQGGKQSIMAGAAALLREMSTIDIGLGPNPTAVTPLAPLVGEDARRNPLHLCGRFISPSNYAAWYNLNGLAYDGVPIFNSEAGNSQDHCAGLVDPGLSRYRYVGTVANLPSRNELFLKHHLSTSNTPFILGNTNQQSSESVSISDMFTDASSLYGGYQVNLKWGGCPQEQGQGLQYLLAPKDIQISTVPGNAWQNVSFNSSGIYELPSISRSNVYGGGEVGTPLYLYLRVISVTGTPPYGYSGFYRLDLTQHHKSSSQSNDSILVSIVRTVLDTLLGPLKNDGSGRRYLDQGAVSKVYTPLCTYIAPTTSVVMAIYITLFAMRFMLGMVQMNSREVTIRIIKVMTCGLAVSKTSLMFMSNYIVPLFVDGSLFLVSDISVKMLGVIFGSSDIIIKPGADPGLLSIFHNLDYPIQIFTLSQVWNAILALAFSSFSGFALVSAIALSMFFYLAAIVRVTLIYLYVTIAQSFLLLVTPFVFTLSMFNYLAEDVFTTWSKNIISNAVVPIAVFTSIILINALVLVTIMSIFSFSFCSFCYFADPITGNCWISLWQPLINSFAPNTGSGFITPIGVLGAAICLLTIAYTSYQIVGYIAQRAATLFVFKPAMETLKGRGGGVGSNLVRSNFDVAAASLPAAKATGRGIYNTVKSVKDGIQSLRKKKEPTGIEQSEKELKQRREWIDS